MKIYLAADSINGIRKIDKSDVDGLLLSGEGFYGSLRDCREDETLFTCVESKELLKKIDTEYGIH